MVSATPAFDGQVLDLLRRYTERVSVLYSRFADAAQLAHPFEWRNKGMARVGQVGGFDYAFHGAGLKLAHDCEEVDFDFGRAGELGGADPWFLAQFAARTTEPELADHMRLREGLAELVKQGQLVKQDDLYWERDYAPSAVWPRKPPVHVGLEIMAPTFWVPCLGRKLGAVDPSRFGLSPALTKDLEAWSSRYDGLVDDQGCVSDAVEQTLHAEGLELWKRVADELGDRFEVHYDSPWKGESFCVR